jgi:hypothetical protein
MKKLTLYSLLIICPVLTSYSQSSKYTISGYVKEKGSGELLIGVNIFLPDRTAGTTTNTFGFYSLTLPAQDSLTLVVSYVGYRQEVLGFPLKQNTEMNIELTSDNVLQEVVVHANEYEDKVSDVVQMSKIDVPVRQIKDIPALLGEKDVLKVLQLMPGVQKGSEGNSGIYVRGGGPDQNLLILDDAVVYNAYHLFGFFSLFNGDALKTVELTKGGFPARYGGRLSSVIDMNMKEGNKEEVHGVGGIGLISSRLTLEGPLKKEKSSFLISGRRTYVDALIAPFMPKEESAGYYFYDFNAKVNYDFGRKDKLYLSGYFGKDKFHYGQENTYDNGSETVKRSSDGGFQWGNATGTLRWNHLFNDRLFSNTSLIFSNYQFLISLEEQNGEDIYNLSYKSGIRDFTVKYDWDFLPEPRHSIKFGLMSTYHRFTPSASVMKERENTILENEVDNIDVLESGIYIEDTYKPTTKFKVNGGLRLSHFKTEKNYYLNLEPRVAVSYNLRDDISAKASYAIMNQYVHLLSNTGVGLPTDLWVPTTDRIVPQQSQQVAAGLAKDIHSNDLALTLEGYYKKMDNIIGYKEGATFLMIEDYEEPKQVPWEDNVTSGQGWSYGMEFQIQKKVGKLSGWIGYTLSWTQLQFDSLNFGKKYYARYDRRHDLSLVGIYKLSDKITLSGTWVYGTGNALTLPIASFSAPGHSPRSEGYYYDNIFNQREDYGEKNSFRMAAYHRFDLGIQFHKKKKWGERTWEISFYNIYNRKNPFFYYIDSMYDSTDNTERPVLKQVTLFPIIPSVSYSFKF